MVLPGEGFHDDRDLLARASGGKATELKVATDGATEGESVGNSVWTSHKIGPDGMNTRQLVRALGVDDSREQRVMYGSIILHSHREQQTRMFAGSDDTHRAWLNGQLVSKKYRDWAHDYQQSFPVTLKQGKNVLLIAVLDWQGGWGGASHFGFAPDAEYAVLASGPRFSLSTETTQVEKGDTFTLHLNAEEITDLAGWQGDIVFDPAVLKANNITEGSFLKQKNGRTFFRKGTIHSKQGKIAGISAARISQGGASGDGALLSIRFTAHAEGQTRILFRNFRAGSNTGKSIPATPIEMTVIVGGQETTTPAWDVNEDGITNAVDVALVNIALGQTNLANPRVDVNGDGIVDGKDLAIVAAHLGEKNAPAAPSVGGISNPIPRQNWLKAPLTSYGPQTMDRSPFNERSRTLSSCYLCSFQRKQFYFTTIRIHSTRRPGSHINSRARGRHDPYLCCEWRLGSDVSSGISTCGYLSVSEPCCVLGW